jgi:hypothetical protein
MIESDERVPRRDRARHNRGNNNRSQPKETPPGRADPEEFLCLRAVSFFGEFQCLRP